MTFVLHSLAFFALAFNCSVSVGINLSGLDVYRSHTQKENKKIVTKIIELLPGTLNFSNLTLYEIRELGVLTTYMGVDKCTKMALDLLLNHWRMTSS